MSQTKIYSFTDLRAWQEGHGLVLSIYQITEAFPAKEQFGLVSQMRRAAVSITSNLAEGFARQGFRDKVKFYSISHGSLTELQNQLLIARDVKFLKGSEFSELASQAVTTHKLISGLIKASKAKYPDS